MITVANVRDWLKTLNTKAEHYYSGKLDSKKEKSFGTYQLKRNIPPVFAIGGEETTVIGEKGITILIHWNKNYRETEEVALALYEEIRHLGGVVINEHEVYYVQLLNNEPVDVGTDEAGIYEFVIDVNLYYER